MSVTEVIIEKAKKIGQLKQRLSETDYIAIKYAEGEITISEYSQVKEQRRKWRAEINALETEIKRLKG